MLGPHVLMVESLRLLVGKLHHLASTIGEAFIHAVYSDPTIVPTLRRPTPGSHFHSTQRRADKSAELRATRGRPRRMTSTRAPNIRSSPLTPTGLPPRTGPKSGVPP